MLRVHSVCCERSSITAWVLGTCADLDPGPLWHIKYQPVAIVACICATGSIKYTWQLLCAALAVVHYKLGELEQSQDLYARAYDIQVLAHGCCCAHMAPVSYLAEADEA